MTHIVHHKPRKYGSPLRAQQAEETRERILDATGRVMAEGLAFVSIPQVAREAGVSVPTVYRHFATKNELLAAVYPYLDRRAGDGTLSIPTTIAELRPSVLEPVGHLDARDDLARAAMASPSTGEPRAISM